MKQLAAGAAWALLMLSSVSTLRPQDSGVIRGQVTLKTNGLPLHHATVVVPKLRRSAETDEDGRFEFAKVPPGRYDVDAHMHHLSDERQIVDLAAGGVVEVSFRLQLAAVHEEVTVTASGHEESTLEAFQTVTSVSSLELVTRNGAGSLGELLEEQTGVAKRSFGPGSSRPVIRGFDGDRVLILEDGMRTGTLSSQSGDHGEPVDAATVERVEIVRGPATLLYGSNAIGGVVNTISSHHQLHEHPHKGLRSNMTASGGSNGGQIGGTGGFEYGFHDWLIRGGGGSQRSGDYHAADGRVPNSKSGLRHANFGFGRYSENASFSFGYGVQDGRYGVPFAAEFERPEAGRAGQGSDKIDLAYRRHQARLTGELRNMPGILESFQLKLNYSDWNHRELEGSQTGTEFFNKQLVYRGEFRHRLRGVMTGTFGFWGLRRDYKASGEETLSPPTDQTAVALFALEQWTLARVRFQLGGRLEYNSYDPRMLRPRSFTGLSAGAGVHLPVWKGGAFVANYTHSHRAPALEELYNNGPHAGNVSFEVGNPDLKGETGDGVDLSLRHQSSRLRGEFNFFYNRLGSFIYFAPAGRFDEGLPVTLASQADSRFQGVEGRIQAGLRRDVWLHLGIDAVNARLSGSRIPLPRIPPARGRLGVEWRGGSLSVHPELVLAGRQSRIAANETETAGYATVNLLANYTVTRQHTLHVFGVNFFNLADRLYRNHLSLIKQFAPEIGRGLRVSYTLHFF